MLPVAFFIWLLIPVAKDCAAKFGTPCSKLVEEDELQQITGSRVHDVIVNERVDSCDGDYEDALHRSLLQTDVQKDSTSGIISFKSRLESYKTDRQVVAVEPVEGFDDEAYIVERHGAANEASWVGLLVKRSSQKGMVALHLYPDLYGPSFSRADLKRFIPILKPRLKLADDYLAKVKPL
jgi:hypothetical protein